MDDLHIGQKTVLFGSAMFNWSETQRMIEIAKQLHQRGCRIVFLGAGKYDHLLDGLPFIHETLEEDTAWYTPQRIDKMLHMEVHGSNYCTYAELDQVVQAELRLIEQYQPSLIVTGYRMTFTVSARIAKLPLAWCLSAVVSRPYLNADTANGVAALDHLSKQELKSLPYQQVRSMYADKLMRERGLKSCKTSGVWNQYLLDHNAQPLDCDMNIYEGDLCLMSDAKELFPDIPEDHCHVYIGPIFNSQIIPYEPHITEALNADTGRKKVLVSIGSNGNKANLIKALQALGELDCEIFVSTIGALSEEDMAAFPDQFHFSEKFPLLDIAARMDAAVIQAGQGTLYAILAAGCPYVSLPSTFEQRHNVRNMNDVFPSGKILYPYEVTPAAIAKALGEVLADPSFREAAKAGQAAVAPYLHDLARLAEATAADHLERLMEEMA